MIVIPIFVIAPHFEETLEEGRMQAFACIRARDDYFGQLLDMDLTLCEGNELSPQAQSKLSELKQALISAYQEAEFNDSFIKATLKETHDQFSEVTLKAILTKAA